MNPSSPLSSWKTQLVQDWKKSIDGLPFDVTFDWESRAKPAPSRVEVGRILIASNAPVAQLLADLMEFREPNFVYDYYEGEEEAYAHLSIYSEGIPTVESWEEVCDRNYAHLIREGRMLAPFSEYIKTIRTLPELRRLLSL